MPIAITATWSQTLIALVLLGYSAPTADAQGSRLDSMLLDAAWHSNAKEVASLLQQGANPNAVGGGGRTPLHRAAQSGHLKVMRLLLDHGANVHARDASGRSVLVEAAGSQDPQAVKMLLEAGAKPDGAALGQACWLGRMEAVKLLLAAGASPDAGIVDAAQGRHVKIVNLLLDKGANVNAKPKGGNSALHTGALQGGFEMVQFLLKAGADPNATNDRGATPLHMAISGDCDIKTIRLLVQSGAKLDLPNHEGVTPLRLAAMRHAKDVYDWLVAANGGTEPRPRFDAHPPRPVAKSTRELLTALSAGREEDRLAAQRELIARGKQVMPEALKCIESGAGNGRLYGLFAAMGPDAEAALPLLTSQLSKKEQAFAAALTLERMRPGTVDALPEEIKQKMAAALYEAIMAPPDEMMAGFYAHMLANLGAPAAPTVMRLLQHKNPRQRALAAEVLGSARFSDGRIEAELVRLARDDEDGSVRAKAARALGTFGEKSEKTKTVLLSIIKNTPTYDARETDPRKNADIRDRRDAADHAARSLARFGPGVIDDLLPLLSPPDAPSRLPAITALQSIGAPAVPRLMELLAHEDRSVAVSASFALSRMGQRAVPALAKAVNTGSEQVVEHAANALWWIGPGAKAAFPDLLEVAGSERRSDLSRLAATRAAVRIDVSTSRQSGAIRSAIPVLIRILEKGKYEHQVRAAETLGHIGAPARDALPVLRKRLELPDENTDTSARMRGFVQQAARIAITAIEADLARDSATPPR